MKLWTFNLILLNILLIPMEGKMLSRSNVLKYEKSVAGAQNPSYLETKPVPYERRSLSSLHKSLKNIDWNLCTIMCGTYLSQGLLINIIFLLIANISQAIQNHFEIDTANLLSGRVSGMLTVSVGSFLSYRISEFLLQYIMKQYGKFGSFSKLYEVITPNKACLTSVQLPINALNRLAFLFPNPKGRSTEHIIESVSESDKDKRQSTRVRTARMQLLKKEIAVISAYSLATFLFLGGNLHSFTPSEVTHPGAYAMPKLSLEADGYNYATKSQKRIIQKVGKTYGCHTCGCISQIERYIADHQPPSGVVKQRLKGKYISFLLKYNIVPLHLVKPRQYFYPQCPNCSKIQSHAVRKKQRKRITHYWTLRAYQLCPTSFFTTRVLFDTKWSRLRKLQP